MLRHWWDNYLTDKDKLGIHNVVTHRDAIKIDKGVQTATKEPIEDAMATLLYCKAMYFIGEPILFQDWSLVILNNLHYKKLGDLKWYKDIFIAKVMTRVDCNNDFCNDKFISGLPPLFSEKVLMKIKDRCDERYHTSS